MARFTEDDSNFRDSLKTKLEQTYGTGNIEILNVGDTIILKINENGTSKFYEYNPSTSENKEVPKGINYNGKEVSEIDAGDDIIIGTEKFMVFAKSNTKIYAMPYYNITLTNTPVQSVNAGTIGFASSNYWEPETDETDMTDSRNNIQTYIERYYNTLQKFGAECISVRVARYSELSLEEITYDMRNPSKKGNFWLGSHPQRTVDVSYINSAGALLNDYFGNAKGVRPIIEIPIS